MQRPELPRRFQSLKALRNLNIAAVGFSLASLVQGLPVWLESARKLWMAPYIFGLPTLLCGVLWAILMRSPKTFAGTKTRRGWVYSIPLAMMNAGLSCGLMMTLDGFDYHGFTIERLLGGFVLGATLGGFIWLPTLLVVLLVFGIPIAKSQKLAERGLSGQERGERILGIVTSILGTFGLLMSTNASTAAPAKDAAQTIGLLLAWLVPIVAMMTGGLASIQAQLRTKRRHEFVENVEAGKVEGFRIDDTPEGRVLMRVTSMGQGYRVANFEEPVYEDSPISEPPERHAFRV